MAEVLESVPNHAEVTRSQITTFGNFRNFHLPCILQTDANEMGTGQYVQTVLLRENGKKIYF